jgi:hypothetical protein
MKEMRAAFDAENVTNSNNRLLLSAAVAVSKAIIDNGYEISNITS